MVQMGVSTPTSVMATIAIASVFAMSSLRVMNPHLSCGFVRNSQSNQCAM
jgi:hypothetical protein